MRGGEARKFASVRPGFLGSHPEPESKRDSLTVQ
jgi:hypothetical protein